VDLPLKRIRELTPTRRKAAERDSFFYRFDAALETDPGRRQILADYEADLACLDEAAWAALKASAAKRLLRIKDRAWHPLFDVLNEAKAYRYLQTLGCNDIAFVPPNYEGKTPDFMAALDGRTVLCEVKTIAASSEEAFLTGKFARVLAEAKAQLSHLGAPDARRIIYVILMITSPLADRAGFKTRLDAFTARAPIAGAEVETSLSHAF
jgi:hypothetical protein